MSDTIDGRCECLDPQCSFDTFHETDIGVDRINWRFGNVSLFDCRYCGCRWLHYGIDCGVFSQSGRWYRGPISMEESRFVTTENAVELLAGLPWYFYGDSHVDMIARRGYGPVPLDLSPFESAFEEIHSTAVSG